MRPIGSARRGMLLATLLGVAAASSSEGQEWHDFRAARQVGDLRSLEVELVYAAGRLVIGPTDGPLLYDAQLRYDAARFEPVRVWSRDGDHGRLRMAVSSVGTDGDATARIAVEDWGVEFDLGSLPDDSDEMGDLHLALHPEIPTSLDLKVGATEARLRLGGLMLEEVRFATAASDTHLQFATPNRIRMKRLSLRSAAAEFRAEDLGNARFETFEFEGAIGEVTLDFSGDWRESAHGRIKMAVGTLRIILPRDIGVRIERKSRLAPMEIEGFRREGDSYYSLNWDSVDTHLDLELAVGLVRVEVEQG